MWLFVLLFVTIIEFLVAIIITKRDYLSPSVIFSSVFMVSTFDLYIMKDFWEVDLKAETVVSISLGIMTFIVFCFIVDNTRNIAISKGHRHNLSEVKKKKMNISRMLYPILFCFYSITALLAFTFVIRMARRYGGSGGIGALIGTYNSLLKKGNDIDVTYPFWIQLMSDFCTLSTYILGYIVINNYSIDKTIDKRNISLILAGIVISMLQGSRGDALAIIFSLTCMGGVILRKKRNKPQIKKSAYLKIIILFALLIVTFQFIGRSLGRDSDLYTPFEYLSIYLGAPILNFNIMIDQVGSMNSQFFDFTFSGLYRSLGKILGIEQLANRRFPEYFLSSNGHRTGNVSTTFYAFYYDAGIIGCVICSIIMAVIMQVLYKKANKTKEKGIDIPVIMYCYMAFMLARSFFSNSLLNAIQLSLLKIIVILYFEKFLFSKIKLQ